ncbi:MAG: hypothetical protein N2484_08630 [Clostridia bacterium]|nr:hypothetical protein [Clostridia bacterium]
MKKNFFYQQPENSPTPGKSLVSFLVGIIFLSMGIFLIFQNTIVTMNFSIASLLGFDLPFGLVMLPLLIGIGMLFFNGRSVLGWLLIIVGIVIILLGILLGLRIYFKPVTLYHAVLMYGLTAAGAGLFLKALLGRKA